MQELYEIMEFLLEVEYKQRVLIYIITELEGRYKEENQGSEKYISSFVKWGTADSQRDLVKCISMLDEYIANCGHE